MQSIVTVTVVAAIVAASCGANVVRVCGPGACATGYHHSNGAILTAAHAVDADADVSIRAPGGYRSRGRVVRVDGSRDLAVVEYDYGHSSSAMACPPVEAGQLVTVSTMRGPVRTRIVAAAPNGYIIDAVMSPGDSGAPVSRRGCVIGAVHGIDDAGKGTMAVLR